MSNKYHWGEPIIVANCLEDFTMQFVERIDLHFNVMLVRNIFTETRQIVLNDLDHISKYVVPLIKLTQLK